MKKILMSLFVIFTSVNITYADTISMTWLNEDGTVSTTTTCDAGDDVILPTTPTKRGYTFMGWEKASYVPIEYLESTGTQYIDTGFNPNNNSGMYLDYYANKSDNPRMAFVVDLNTPNYDSFGVLSSGTAPIHIYNGKNTRISDFWIIDSIYGSGTGRYKVNINERNASVTAPDGSTLTNTLPSYSYQLTTPLYLFSMNNSGATASPAKCKIYSCKIWDNGTLVRDFVPALDYYGTPCMYDKVEKKFYYNAGTGNFIAGPIISE